MLAPSILVPAKLPDSTIVRILSSVGCRLFVNERNRPCGPGLNVAWEGVRCPSQRRMDQTPAVYHTCCMKNAPEHSILKDDIGLDDFPAFIDRLLDVESRKERRDDDPH